MRESVDHACGGSAARRRAALMRDYGLQPKRVRPVRPVCAQSVCMVLTGRNAYSVPSWTLPGHSLVL